MPDPKRDPSSSASGGDKLLLLALGAIAALLILPVVAVAVAAWFAGVRRLSKAEAVILIVASAAITLWWAPVGVADYWQWFTILPSRDGGQILSEFPLLTTVVAGVGVASIYRLIASASVVAGAKVKLGLTKQASALEEMTAYDEVLPDETDRDAIQIQTPPGQLLRINPEQHSMNNTEEFGKRSFPIALGKQGVPVMLNEDELRMHGLIFGATGSGKALDVNTPIATPTGWTTMGRLTVGDIVFDDAGQPCTVTFVTEYQHNHDCYEVCFSDGSHIIADAEHRWFTTTADGISDVLTTVDIAGTLHTELGTPNHWVPACAPINLPAVAVDDPYLSAVLSAGPDSTHQLLPERLLRGSVPQRLDTLRGLMDTSGSVNPDGIYTFHTTSRTLAEQTVELLGTLGIICQPVADGQQPSSASSDDVEYSVSFTSPFELLAEHTRMIAGVPAAAQDRRWITDIVAVSTRPVRCIQVDSPTHLYLAGEAFIPTHNTEAIKVIAGALLDLGWNGIILDHKEDVSKNGLRDWCEEYAGVHGRPYQQIYLSENDPKVWFNPIGGMSADEARDTILASQVLPDAFWGALNENSLGQIISMIYDAYAYDPAAVGEPSPMTIATVMRAGAGMRKASSKYLSIIATHRYPELVTTSDDPLEIPTESQAEDRRKRKEKNKAALEEKMSKQYPIIYHPSADEAKSVVGFASRLEKVYFSEVGRVLLNADGQRRMFDVTTPGLTYVGLDSQGKPDLTKLVSASMMRRLCVLASQRIRGTAGPKKQTFIIIDEANVVDRSSLMELLSRARSAGLTVIAATQGPLDYNMNLDKTPFSGPGFAEIAQNTNVLIAMSQNTPEQAELMADFIGKTERTLLPSQATVDGEVINAGGLRVVRDWRVSPDRLRGLRIGEAVVRVGKPRERVEWAQFKMRSERGDR